MENQRVRLTKRLLMQSLVDILQNVPLNKVTISQVCAKAGINRTTFYKHYSDEYALYYDIEHEAIEMLKRALSFDKDKALGVILSFFGQQRKLAFVLFNANVDEELPEKLFSLPEIKNIIRGEMVSCGADFEKIYFFICNGGYALIKDWINGGFKESPAEIEALLSYIVKRLVG